MIYYIIHIWYTLYICIYTYIHNIKTYIIREVPEGLTDYGPASPTLAF